MPRHLDELVVLVAELRQLVLETCGVVKVLGRALLGFLFLPARDAILFLEQVDLLAQRDDDPVGLGERERELPLFLPRPALGALIDPHLAEHAAHDGRVQDSVLHC